MTTFDVTFEYGGKETIRVEADNGAEAEKLAVRLADNRNAEIVYSSYEAVRKTRKAMLVIAHPISGCGKYTTDVGNNPIVCGENGDICEKCDSPQSSNSLKRKRLESDSATTEEIREGSLHPASSDKRTVGIPPSLLCKHENKSYSPFVLASNPPQYPWICRECGQTGTEWWRAWQNNDYDEIREKFGK